MSFKLRIILLFYKLLPWSNSSLERFLEKRIAKYDGGFAYSRVIRKIYRENIGNDVWIGENAVILPSCHSIGDGAIVGAGAIVTKDIPTYAVVAGNPAKILRYRFSPKQIDYLQSTRWWELSKNELALTSNEIQQNSISII